MASCIKSWVRRSKEKALLGGLLPSMRQFKKSLFFDCPKMLDIGEVIAGPVLAEYSLNPHPRS